MNFKIDNKNNVVVTKHAKKRSKERLGLNKKSIDKNAEKAFLYGITHSETKGSLNRYLSALFYNSPSHKWDKVCIYGHYIYIFKKRKLITVMESPKKYHRYIDMLMEKKGSVNAKKEKRT